MVGLLACAECGESQGGGLTWLVVTGGVMAVWLTAKWAWTAWKSQGVSNMNRIGRTLGVVAVVAAAATLVVATMGHAQGPAEAPASQPATVAASLPRLVDFGSQSCIPCKKMEPILAQLKAEYAGRLDVEFVDVGLRENAPRARAAGIQGIPTQIFLNAEGKEVWRHVGYIAKADLLAKWRELGLDKAATSQPASQVASQPATAPACAPTPCCPSGGK